MMPKSVLWPLEPQTRGKHRVLRYYLEAWLPIMGSWAGRILFIDGFAGPGKYEGGEDGSPVIALKSLLEHRHKNKISAEVKFIFIEKDRGRCEYLDALMDDWEEKLPTNCSLEVVLGKFDETMSRALDALDEQAKHLAPSFVMIDPFGVSGTPMSVIERILKNSQSEVYVSFMYESMNRFKDTPDFAPHLDALFGCEDWRDGIDDGQSSRAQELFLRVIRGSTPTCGT